MKTFLSSAIDVVLPPRCIGTGEIVTHQGMISPSLWQDLCFIGPPYCACCGLPFEFSEEFQEETLCTACIETPPRYDLCRAALTYNDASRTLLLKFKYGDQLHAAVTFANWMKNTAPGLWQDIDYIVPTPLHWRRLWQRRFNQSALLAQALGTLTGTPVLHALKRVRFTGPQKGLSKKERQKNVRLAFKVNPKALPGLKGKTVALLDDVLTSGATVNECAKNLKTAGAANVYVFTVARVLKESDYNPEFDDFAIEEGV